MRKEYFEIYKDMPREGPGDNKSTKRAFMTLKNLHKNPKILDIGCGTGMQTLELARNADGKVYGMDTQELFLNDLMIRASKESLDNKIETIKGSMFSLEEYFHRESFDVIWSEGAIYIMGFESGLNSWKPFIKSDGYLVVSEISWLKDNPPKEIKDFWQSDYPDMRNIEENIKIIEKSGYSLIDNFIIPEKSWWDNYYTPRQERIKIAKDKYKDDIDIIKSLNSTELEIDMYKRYSEYYGYVFYIMQK